MKYKSLMFKHAITRGGGQQIFYGGGDTDIDIDENYRRVRITDAHGVFEKPFDDVQWCEPIIMKEAQDAAKVREK